ncbi:hypothetical protein BDQ17DRAFT_1327256 [Cyathus striatus]|nr:hypothetical protein BDQ17DRAFT_1327256 [Cyathus striatus]
MSSKMQFECDDTFLASVSEDIIHEFCDQVLSKEFVINHPEVFLTNDWVDITRLQEFIRQQGDDTTFPSAVPDIENNNIIDLCGFPPDSTRLADVRTCIIQENSCEVIEIQDMDSEEEVEEPIDIEPLSSISPTTWLDNDVETTGFKEGKVSLSKVLEVEAVQYIKGLPTAWPIPSNMIMTGIHLMDPMGGVTHAQKSEKSLGLPLLNVEESA